MAATGGKWWSPGPAAMEAWDFVRRCLRGFVALEGTDRALTIAAQAFVALIPLFILVSAAGSGGSGDSVADFVIDRFHLTGDAQRSIELLFQNPAGVGSLSIFSVLLVVLAGLSFTRRLQRMYEAAWHRPASGVRGSLSAAMGLAALLVQIVLLYFLSSLVRGLPLDRVLLMPLSAAAGLVLWTSIPYLLLARRVAWRRLLPTGALAASTSALYGVATTIYMPSLIERYSSRYGLMGATIALLGWLLCIAFVIVVTAVVGAEFDRTDAAWATSIRGWVMEHTTKAPKTGQAALGEPPRDAPDEG